jgi:hypothetical protein
LPTNATHTVNQDKPKWWNQHNTKDFRRNFS